MWIDEDVGVELVKRLKFFYGRFRLNVFLKKCYLYFYFYLYNVCGYYFSRMFYKWKKKEYFIVGILKWCSVKIVFLKKSELKR